jgi:hypothetical protein
MPKLAVAIIHGIGNEPPTFADAFMAALERRFVAHGGRAEDLVQEPVYWSDVLEGREEELLRRLEAGGALRWHGLRAFMVEWAADAIAYQPTPNDRHVYDGIHARLAAALRRLSRRAGPDAPLCLVAHSLGTVIASNYVYDVQTEHGHVKREREDPTKPLLTEPVRREMGDAPLDRLETLFHLVTMGSPLALWSLRFPNADPRKDYGVPIVVPSPLLEARWPALLPVAGWTNVYDADDVIGYPLKGLNDAYARAVREDVQVNVGTLLTNWNPASHGYYWTEAGVDDAIARRLAEAHRAADPGFTATSSPR